MNRSIRTLLLIGLVAAMIKVPSVLVYSKYVLDNYAGGFSGTKAILLVLFLAVLSGLSPLPSIWRERWNPYLGAGLFLCFLFQMGEYVQYCRHWGLPFDARSLLVHDGLVSSTRPEHIHNSKAALAALLPYGGQRFDIGRPYLSEYPHLWLLFHAAVFLVVCLSSVAMVHHYQKKFTPERSLFLALVNYRIVKAAIDGGPLSIPDLACFTLVVVALLRGRGQKWATALLMSLLPVALFVSWEKGLVYNLYQYFLTLFALALPLLWERARTRIGARWKMATAAAVLVVLTAPVVYYQAYPFRRQPPFTLASIQYGRSELKEGWTVNIVSPRPLNDSTVGQVVEYRQGNTLYLSRVKLKRSTTPFELCRIYGLNLLRKPVVWYQKSAYVRLESPLKLPPASQWLTTETVTGHSLQWTGERSILVLELYRGGHLNIAVDSLPEGPIPFYEIAVEYRKPDTPARWENGPGKP